MPSEIRLPLSTETSLATAKETSERTPPANRFLNPELAPFWLSAIIESAEDAIITKTLEGIITSWNPGAERLFGYTATEMIGQPVAILIPPEHHDEEPQILSRLRRGEKIEHYETVRVRKNGERIDISLTVSPIRGADGSVIGASKIARNITDRKQAERERERLLHEAREASRLKDEFLAMASHELRTPLNAILGWANMIRSGEAEAEDVEHGLLVIERSARTQAQLIDDLLDVARIRTGKIILNMQPVELRALIATVVDTVRPAAEAKELQLQLHLDAAVSPVSGDGDRLQQVFWNLLSNAVKFTPPGGQVQVTLQEVESQVQVVVSDSGQGITAEFLPYVFERFRQADMSSTREHNGLGMGLAIVKSIVELHGGTVRAFSEGQGKGATFIVSFP